MHIGYFILATFTILIIFGIWAVYSARRSTSPAIIFQNPDTMPVRHGFSKRVLNSGGMVRGYLLYVPGSYNSDQALPLVVSLHGFASNPYGQQYLSRWEKLAEKENFIVVYPQGTSSPLRWNASRDFENALVDDVAFIRDLLDAVEGLVNIDHSRIYVNGMSNGGSMTARLACEMANTLAAVGIVSAPPINFPGGCHPVRPIPMIAFYGTEDPLVSYSGGSMRASWWSLRRRPVHAIPMPPVGAWIEDWARRNLCNPDPQVLVTRGDAGAVKYSGNQLQNDVIFYTIQGGGHTWPGGSPTFLGKTSRSIHATEEMWEFFKAHPMHEK